MPLKIGIFIEKYLTLSMTFIYRQVINLNDDFEAIVLTSAKPSNLDKYPIKNIYFKSKSFPERVYYKLLKKTVRPTVLSNIDREFSFSQKKYFKRLLEKQNFDIIHAHFGPSAIEIFPVIEHSDLPFIVSFHGYDASMLLKSSLYVEKLQPIFKKSFVIVPSEYMKLGLEKINCESNKIEIIHYGIPLEQFPFIPRKNFDPARAKFLQVSNLVEKKGHEYSIKAFRNYVNKYPEASFTIAGDGSLRENLERLVKQLNLSKNIKFVGKVNPSEVQQYFRNADVFVHHSITSSAGDQEGIPNVIMEAMAMGLPVISSYHAGIPELIKSGQNGFLVKEKDIDGLTEKMLCIYNCAEEFSLEGRATIESEFNLRIQLQKLEHFYRRIAREN